MLSKRCRSITLDIIKSPADVHELAHKYKVSERAIRNDLFQVDDFLSIHGFSRLKYNEAKKYCLPVEGEKAGIIFQLINSPETVMTSYSSWERLLELLYQLSASSHPIKIDDLAGRLFVSRSSIVKDIEKLKKELKIYNVSIQGTAAGMKLTGTEINIRFAILELYFSHMEQNTILELIRLIENKNAFTSYKVHWHLFEDVPLERILSWVDFVKYSLSIHLSDYMFLYTIAAFSLMIKRTGRITEDVSLQEGSPFTTICISSLFADINQDKKYPESEKAYIYQLFLRLRPFLHKDDGSLDSPISKFFELVQPQYHLSDNTIKNITEEFRLIYFQKEFHHMEYHHVIELKDPQLDIHHLNVDSIIDQCGFPFSFTYDEIWQITWHLIGQPVHKEKKKVVIISDKPASLTNLLVNRLKSLFDIELLGISSVSQIAKFQESNIVDYFISTLRIPDIPNLLKVHPLLQETEIKYLKNYLDTFEIETGQEMDAPITELILQDGSDDLPHIFQQMESIVIQEGVIPYPFLRLFKMGASIPLTIGDSWYFSLRQHEIVNKNFVIRMPHDAESIVFCFFTSTQDYLAYMEKQAQKSQAVRA